MGCLRTVEALTSRLIFLAGVQWSSMQINKFASPPYLLSEWSFWFRGPQSSYNFGFSLCRSVIKLHRSFPPDKLKIGEDKSLLPVPTDTCTHLHEPPPPQPMRSHRSQHLSQTPQPGSPWLGPAHPITRVSYGVRQSLTQPSPVCNFPLQGYLAYKKTHPPGTLL